jgi:hypothetical protein
MKLADFKMNSQPELHTMKRAVLDFGKYHLSVITGGIGNTEAPYEIAVLNSKDGVARGFVQLPGITGPDDDVRGHMTEEEVDVIIKKMYSITSRIPVQV